MSRYLTASKICLLILVAMYCDGYIPPAATLNVLSFITDQLLSDGTYTQKRRMKHKAISNLAIEDFSALLSPLKSRLASSQSNDLWHDFLAVSWRISDLDRLFDFFQSLPQLFDTRQNRKHGPAVDLIQIVLRKNSILGAFVRRAKLEFERLVFQDAVKLWQSYEHFRAPANPDIKDDNFEGLDSHQSDALHTILYRDLHFDKEPFQDSSAHDLERLLNFQVEKMQKTGVRLPEEVKDKLQHMAGSSAEVSSLVFYARFLDSWYAGDYASSFDNLHRYYDYAMHNKGRSHYQYALLNMAILQADFGCHTESMAAMQETIATARENKDMPCLNFSLSWLYHFRTLYGGRSDNNTENAFVSNNRKTLEFLKTKAQESNMWSLVSSTLLNEAKLILAKGQPPYEAIELVYQSSYLNLHHHIASVNVSQLLTRSAIFGRLGITSLCDSNCQLVFSCYALTSPAEEVMKARCRNAHTVSQTGRFYRAKLSKQAFLAGDKKIMSASTEELSTSTLHNLQFHQYASTYVTLLKLKTSLHRNDLNAADNVLSSLLPVPQSDPDLYVQLHYSHIDYLVRIESFSEALVKLNSLFKHCDREDLDVFYRLKLLTMKAKIFQAVGRPRKGFSLAVRATAVAWRARILPAMWDAVACLAVVLTSLEEYKAADQLVNSVLYQAHESEDAIIIADLYSAAADASMGLAGQSGETELRHQLLRKTMSRVATAREYYEKVEELLKIREMTEKTIRILEVLEESDKVPAEAARLNELKKQRHGVLNI